MKYSWTIMLKLKKCLLFRRSGSSSSSSTQGTSSKKQGTTPSTTKVTKKSTRTTVQQPPNINGTHQEKVPETTTLEAAAGSRAVLEAPMDSASTNNKPEEQLEAQVSELSSTSEELQATLQELADLQTQLADLQSDNARLTDEKAVVLQSLCKQTERLEDCRARVESLTGLLCTEGLPAPTDTEARLLELIKQAAQAQRHLEGKRQLRAQLCEAQREASVAREEAASLATQLEEEKRLRAEE
ncbi:UNVERIFIED_CONTAM: hypothetical protein B566_EDAN018617, partial [Ephemera danica]